jgi:type I restriction enzyme S subunit
MSDWRHITLGDLAKAKGCKIQTGPFGSQLHKHEYQAEGIGVVNPTHMADRRVSHDTVPCVSAEVAQRLSKHQVRPGDLLFARRGEIGRHALITESERGWLCGTGCFLVRVNGPESDSTYISFYLSTDESVEWLNRHAAGVVMPNLSNNVLQRVPVALPPLPEQKKIAHILSTMQRAIEAQERIIQTTTELKKALMHKLFTEGLRHEPQKQTEIGPVPQSWEVVRCEDVCDTISVGIVVKPSSYYVKEGVPAFRSQNVREDRIQPEPMVYISEESNNGPVKKSKLSAGDVLIVRTGYPGTSCVVPPEFDGSNCIDLIFVRPNKEKLRSHYLSRFFNSDAAKVQVQAGKIGLAQQHFNVGAVKNTQMPLPPPDQQDEIVSHLELIDSKHNLTTSKRNTLQDLFRTLLHQLMTAQIRTQGFE